MPFSFFSHNVVEALSFAGVTLVEKALNNLLNYIPLSLH